MAKKVQRRTGWQIRWQEGGRHGSNEGEFFEDELAADQFKLLVEYHGNKWPPGWVPGHGFVSEEEIEARRQGGTRLLKFANKRFDNLREARDIGPDTYVRYQRYARLFAGALPIALALAEAVDEDDTLRRLIVEEPTDAYPYLHKLTGDLSEEDLARGADFIVEDVDADTIQAWVRYMRVMGKSTKTIRNYHGCLHGVFEDAVDAGLITRNPCAKTKLGANVPVRRKVILEPQEFWWVWDCLDPHYRDFVEVAVGTGMRLGELTATRVMDWLPEANKIVVEEAWKKGSDGRYYRGRPKTLAGIRDVYVEPGGRVAQILTARCEGKDPEDLLFTAKWGGRIRQNVFGELWAVAVATARQELGLTQDPKFHDLRHTHISWLRDAHMPDAAIKDLVGHTDPEMTSRYGGVTQATRDAAASAIQNRLRRS